ncbi:MAG TPA: phospholipid carrier-dependent glycosyltransferase [Nocardioides sp.]|uniref:phospholipid carrier-dependent glycosyltransferase n=1 Tax=Nocardioides sp. TaxID=35761 RepID=UPI002E3030F3|nr:phospholipid carrier-dependent glycosyltransferase [Nocardioides sp.]HEX5089946.1 phospholipid carrier-dependent glycosyltransferase [Nocardioides sp.]
MAWRDHRPFLVLLGAGAALRVMVQLAFPPAFVFSDGPGYLGLVDDLTPSSYRVVGYGLVLRALSWVSDGVWLVAVTQHLLGLATAVLAYVLLRRWGVGSWVAAMATVPVLFDGMQLVLEHSVLSEVVFNLVVLAGVGALAWHRRPQLSTTVLAGLLLGAAACVRLVGQPLLAAAVVFCLLAAATWRDRLVHAVVVTAAFLVPVLAYAGWYHHDHDAWALSDSGGRALYMRTTAWVDCSRFTMPDYERPLCPEQPVGHRLDPTEYGWHTPDASHDLTPPDGVSVDDAMHDFAVRAIRAQPWDYARTVLRDVALNFWPTREDRYEYDTADKWSFARYVDREQLTGFTEPAYRSHGGSLPTVHQPGASWLATYGTKAYLWGPALLALFLLAIASLFVPGRRSAPRRSVIALLLMVGGGLMVAPDVTAEFVWRYQLPAILLVPMAAALGWTRMRSPRQEGTAATPSTDWPNGGRTLRSTNRVVGTSQRS